MFALIVFAIFFALIGLIELTSATTGVGLIGIACLFGILARIAQAGHRSQPEKPPGEMSAETIEVLRREALKNQPTSSL